MPLPTPAQYEKIREVVRLYHEAVVDGMFGPSQLPESVIKRLEDLGVPRWGRPPLAEQAVQWGALTAALPDPGALDEMSYADFLRRIKRRPQPLTKEETAARDYVARYGATYCRGLGNTVSKTTGEIIIEADQKQREWMEEAIRTEVAEGIKWRETRGEIKTRLGRATGDWSRDLQRIANTEENNATQRGRGAVIEAEHGPDARVAKIPEPGACEACRALYLDRDGRPKIFALSEIRDATNARDPARPGKGRRRVDYLPTLESLHPHCRCSTTYVPDHWDFDSEWDLVPEEDADR